MTPLRGYAINGRLPTSHYSLSTTPSRRSRGAFTLIELMVAISIIGILSAMALGGMYRANVSAKQLNSKTTVNKVAVLVNEIWESYRTRKLPIDPKLVLQSNGNPNSPYYAQYSAATGTNGFSPGWLPYFSQIRNAAGIPAANDPINAQPGTATFGNNIQIAALRLAAVRELMRLEMPYRYTDFTDNPAGINSGANPNSVPPVTGLLIPQPRSSSNQPLANPTTLSEQYRQFFINHYNAIAVPYDPLTSTYEPAECLYMIIKFASQNDIGQKNITDDPRLVGDADGDGMPEIQDAFNVGTFTPPAVGSPFTQHNKPISFIRWPAGFLSDLQPGPTGNQTPSDYASARHDIFDPLRVDPRAFTLTPLVYSGGPDGTFDIWELNGYGNLSSTQRWFAQNDPYYTDNFNFTFSPFPIITGAPPNPWPGTQMAPGVQLGPSNLTGTGAYNDNITNHLPSTSRE